MTVIEWVFAILGWIMFILLAYATIRTICMIIYLGIKHLPKED